MNERTFNSLMPRVNEGWAAKVLNMRLNEGIGPDLIDDEKAVEIKFKIQYSDGRYAHKCWKVQKHQIDYKNDYNNIYWGVGFYYFNRNISQIKNTNINNLESFVDSRELYIVNWEWINQFPHYHHKGKTEKSGWDYEMLFPKFKRIPEITAMKNVEGGKIFFTDNIDPKIFEEINYKVEEIPF